ncbi:hypothetical protein [Alkalibacillus haloalkaliphilus]|uniref:hypothetical protein n=1 Tax=Alkalibacillus haloalkaliphilus TaxID=94136 RepID=UPI0002EF0A2F|nr:hypothetical protein [Alkalibacillus haloalkaliphilus]
MLELIVIILSFFILMVLLQRTVRKFMGLDTSWQAIFQGRDPYVNDRHRKLNQIFVLIGITLLIGHYMLFNFDNLTYVILITFVLIFRGLDIFMFWKHRPQEKVHWIMLINTVVILTFFGVLLALSNSLAV